MKLVLLVISLICMAFSQVISVDRCLSILSEKDCKATSTASNSAISCQWCASDANIPGICRAKESSCECKECDLALKPDVLCPNSEVKVAFECSTRTCSWIKSTTTVCETPLPECCDVMKLSARVCLDGTEIRPTCNPETCEIKYPQCEGCNACSNVEKPKDFKTFVCPDGKPGGHLCINEKCAYDYVPCSNTGSCPEGVRFSPCLIAPCSRVTQENMNPLVASKQDNYCGDECNCICLDKEGNKINCINNDIPPPIIVRCEEKSCSEQPVPVCDNVSIKPLYACVPTPEGKCAWSSACVDPVKPIRECFPGGPGCAKEDIEGKVINSCNDGTRREFQCLPIEIQSASADSTVSANIRISGCSWQLPNCKEVLPTPENKCRWAGVCGQECVLDKGDSPALSIAFDADVCRKAAVNGDGCENICKFESRGTCTWRDTGCVAGSPVNDYQACVDKCRGVIVPPPTKPCLGDLCGCDIGENCYFCNQKFKNPDSGKELVFGTCLSNKFPDACSAFGGNSLIFKPANECAIALPIRVPDILKPYLEKLKGLSREALVEEIRKLAANNEEVKNLLLSIRGLTTPKSNDVEVELDIIVDVVGVKELTASQKEIICNKLKEAAKNTGDVVIKECTLDKLTVSNTVKRQANDNDEGTYVANLKTDSTAVPNGPSPNASGSSVLVASVMSLIALLALFF